MSIPVRDGVVMMRKVTQNTKRVNHHALHWGLSEDCDVIYKGTGMYYIGIDTGWSGAIAIYNGDKYFVYDCPNPKGKPAVKMPEMVKFVEGLLSQKRPDGPGCIAMIEEPFAMARKREQGYDSGSSMLSYGANHGAWLYALHRYGIRVESIHPRTWQAALLKDMPGNNAKERSRAIALQLAPYLEKQLSKSKSGRYDAINIAYYLSTLHRG